MEKLPVSVRRVSESLLEAALRLDSAGVSHDELHLALAETAVAIEYHLDTLSAQLRIGAEHAIEPRLRPAAARLEGELHGLLTRSWTADAGLAGGEPPPALGIAALAADIRRAASDELDMVFESFRSTGDSA